jgi:serine/threonine protein kinase
MSIAPSTRVGLYRIVSAVGAGGMGEVYRAEESEIGRVWALKTLVNAREGSELWRRFMNEGQIHSRLEHPGIAAFREMFLFGGQPCIVMEYVDGETVFERLARLRRLDSEEAARVLAELSDVLTYLHSKGIVHRDLKSSNIKINSLGQTKLLDFGIARMEGGQRLTRVGAVMGTPETLAPELLDGRPAGMRTEIWGLGVLGYEMVTGTMPFEGATDEALYRAVRTQSPVPPSVRNPLVPAQFEKVLLRCLEKNPGRRYGSSKDLKAALSICASREDLRQKAWPAFSPRIKRAATLTAICVAMLSGLYSVAGNAASDDTQTVTIESADGPADVFRNGEHVGKTPYRVRARTGDNVQLELRRPGFLDQPVQFDVTERKVYSYTLQRARR